MYKALHKFAFFTLLLYSFSVISVNIVINNILPTTRFHGLHFCPTEYGSSTLSCSFNRFDVDDASSVITQDNAIMPF